MGGGRTLHQWGDQLKGRANLKKKKSFKRRSHVRDTRRQLRETRVKETTVFGPAKRTSKERKTKNPMPLGPAADSTP